MFFFFFFFKLFDEWYYIGYFNQNHGHATGDRDKHAWRLSDKTQSKTYEIETWSV